VKGIMTKNLPGMCGRRFGVTWPSILVAVAFVALGWMGYAVADPHRSVRMAGSGNVLRELSVADRIETPSADVLRTSIPIVVASAMPAGLVKIRGRVTKGGAPAGGMRLRVLPVAGRRSVDGERDPIYVEGVWGQTGGDGTFEVDVPQEHYGAVWASFQIPSPDRAFTYFEGVLPIEPEPIIEVLDPTDPDWEARGALTFEVEPDYPLSLELYASQVSQPSAADWQLRVLGAMSDGTKGVSLRGSVGPLSMIRGAILLDIVDRRGVGVALLRFDSIDEFREALTQSIRVATGRRSHSASGDMGCPRSVAVQRLHGPSVMRGGSDPLEVDSTGNVEFVTAVDAFVCEGFLADSRRLLGVIHRERATIDWSRALPGTRPFRVEVVDAETGDPIARAAVLCRSADHSIRADHHEEMFYTDQEGVAVALLVTGSDYEIQASTREVAGRVRRSPIVRVDLDFANSTTLRASPGNFVQFDFRGLPRQDRPLGLAEICVETSVESWERRWVGYPMGPYGIFLAPGSYRVIGFLDGFGTEAMVHVSAEPRSLNCVLDLRPLEHVTARVPASWIERGVTHVTSTPALPGLGWPSFAISPLAAGGSLDLWILPGHRRTLDLWRDGVKIAECALDARGEIWDAGPR
jgi:hypothetical protein